MARILKAGLALCVVIAYVGSAWEPAKAATQVSLVDQGWQINEQAGKRVVELSALVVNEGQAPLEYEVTFIVEASEQPLQAALVSRGKQTDEAGPPSWLAVQTAAVRGGPLGPGLSATVTASLPYQVLKPGRAYRFRAELRDGSAALPMAESTITPLARPFAVAASVARIMAAFSPADTALPLSLEAPIEAGERMAVATAGSAKASGSGTMIGRHNAQRVGGEWVEHGSGGAVVMSSQGLMILDYTYDAHGPSAATLTAAAKATGWLIGARGARSRVQVTSASANMTYPGTRRQSGPVITRSRATATGTFSGTVGGAPWSGVLTMWNGVQTLNLNTNMGLHSFSIQFTASR